MIEMESIHLGKYVTRWLAGRILYVGDQVLTMDGSGTCETASEKDIRDALRFASELIEQEQFHPLPG